MSGLVAPSTLVRSDPSSAVFFDALIRRQATAIKNLSELTQTQASDKATLDASIAAVVESVAALQAVASPYAAPPIGALMFWPTLSAGPPLTLNTVWQTNWKVCTNANQTLNVADYPELYAAWSVEGTATSFYGEPSPGVTFTFPGFNYGLFSASPPINIYLTAIVRVK